MACPQLSLKKPDSGGKRMTQRSRVFGLLLGVGLAGLAGLVSAARHGRKPMPLRRIRSLGGESRGAGSPGPPTA